MVEPGPYSSRISPEPGDLERVGNVVRRHPAADQRRNVVIGRIGPGGKRKKMC